MELECLAFSCPWDTNLKFQDEFFMFDTDSNLISFLQPDEVNSLKFDGHPLKDFMDSCSFTFIQPDEISSASLNADPDNSSRNSTTKSWLNVVRSGAPTSDLQQDFDQVLLLHNKSSANTSDSDIDSGLSASSGDSILNDGWPALSAEFPKKIKKHRLR